MSDYLPEEVVQEILNRLPVKSLIRFRCVSKSWNSLITASSFINSHLTRSLSLVSNSNTLVVRSCTASESKVVESYNFIHDDNNDDSLLNPFQNIEFSSSSFCKLIGYANGLFCLYEQDRYVLWNPSIRKCFTLPKSSLILIRGHHCCRSAFGFDSRSNDYKVVTIDFQRTDQNNQSEGKPALVEVYSLNEGSWRVTSTRVPFPTRIIFDFGCFPAAFLNGAVHYTVNDLANDRVPRIRDLANRRGPRIRPSVLSFDLSNEAFRVMSLPVGMTHSYALDTSVIRGALFILCHALLCQGNKCYDVCSIWVMKKYGIVDSWTKLCNINLTGEITRVLGFLKSGHMLVTTARALSVGFASFNPKNREVMKLGMYGAAIDYCANNYVENLVLLDKPNDAVSQRGVTRKRKCRSRSLQSDQISAANP